MNILTNFKIILNSGKDLLNAIKLMIDMTDNTV